MSGVSDLELASWFDQVADGLEAGMPASDAVALAKELPRGASGLMIEAFRLGSGWLGALQDSGLPLTRSEEAIIDAASMSGALPRALRRLATARSENSKIKRRVKMSLLYPIFLLHFAALVFSIGYLMDGQTSSFLVSVGMIVVPFWCLALFAAMLARYCPGAIKWLARRLPMFSSYRKKWDIGVLCDTLATCFSAGMDVTAAWRSAINAADDARLTRVGESVLESVQAGGPASEGLAKQGKRVPESLVQLYRSGEQTGALDQNLAAAADRYYKDAKSSLFLAAMIYPKVILVGIFLYVGYKIVTFFQDYYQQILDIAA